MTTRVLVGALVALCACGDDAGPLDSAAPDADAGASVTPAPPVIDWLAVGVPPLELTPCPEGWRELTEAGVTVCDPYPEGGPVDCPTGEAHFAGEPGCRAIGDACPIGGWADVAAGVPTIYVDAAAAPGGDGSVAAPYASLTEVGFATLSAGTTVALARGSYEGVVPLPAGVRLLGACASETLLTGLDTPTPAVVSVSRAGEPARIENVTIASPPQGGVQVASGRALELRGVAIEGARGTGLYVTDVGSLVTATELVVEGTIADSGGMGGIAIQVTRGARVEATKLELVRNRDMAIYVTREGSALELVDATVRDTQSASVDGLRGRGMFVQTGGQVTITRGLFAANREHGILAVSDGTRVELSDVVVRDTEGQASGRSLGGGMAIETGAALVARRLLVAGNRDPAVLVGAATAELVDVVVRDTRSEDRSGLGGRAFGVQMGARVQITRLVAERNQEVGLFAGGMGEVATEMTVTDAVIRGTRAQDFDTTLGAGVSVQDLAHLTLSRVLIEDNREVGAFADGEGALLDLDDVVIRATRERETDSIFGSGLSAQRGGRIAGRRVVVDEVIEVGVMSFEGGTLELEDFDLVNVAPSRAAGRVLGYGVAAIGGVTRLDRFSVSDAATCGLFVAPAPETGAGGSLDATNGSVAGSEIGACVQMDGYDLARITTEVRYQDNGVNLDSTTLPVPDPLDPL